MSLDCTLNRADLVSALTRLSGVIPMRTVLPVFQCVRLSRVSTGLRVEATDGDRHAEVPLLLAAEVAEFEPVCVSLVTLRDVAQKGSAVEARLSAGERGLLFACGAFRGKLPAIPDSEWPALRLDGSKFSEVGYGPALALKAAFACVDYAICADLTRPAALGVNFGLNGTGTFAAKATNGHILAREHVEGWEGEMGATTIPTAAVHALMRFLPDSGDVRVLASETRLRMVHESGTLTTGTLDTPFPNLDAVIPKDNRLSVRVNRAELLAAVGRIKIVLRGPGIARTSVTISPSGIALQAEGETGSADESIPADVEGLEATGLRIGLSADYMADTLSSLTGEHVTITFGGDRTATLWHGEGGAFRLVMPLRLL